MNKKLHIFIIDNDEAALKQYSTLLQNAGHVVSIFTSSHTALNEITTSDPDCIICDLSLPEMDGTDLFLLVQELKKDNPPTFIMTTSKQFDYDYRQAIELGVDGYFIKPINPDTFVTELLDIIDFPVSAEIWGCRGTLPVPGTKSVRYGGNTNCVTLTLSKNHFFIFDAGTGIKELSNYLLKKNKFPFSARIFITHPHYDHINGIPFFTPFYMAGNKFEFYGCNHNEHHLEKIISKQMDSVYFPVTTKEWAAEITYQTVSEESFHINGIKIKTMLLNHPGRCLGYRIEFKGKSFCYVTDHELYLENSPYYSQFDVDRLIDFIKEVDLLVIDATYTDEEYLKKIGWGHSCISRVVDVADKAKVKLLCLHHHDPDQTDDDIDAKLEQAKSILRARESITHCIASREGEKIIL